MLAIDSILSDLTSEHASPDLLHLNKIIPNLPQLLSIVCLFVCLFVFVFVFVFLVKMIGEDDPSRNIRCCSHLIEAGRKKNKYR